LRSPAFTLESVDDYAAARESPAAIHQSGAFLVIEDVQLHQLLRTRDIVVVQPRSARVVMALINRERRNRFAQTT
jgi:hypothetical protein